MLTQEEKDKIFAEEKYRNEVKLQLDSGRKESGKVLEGILKVSAILTSVATLIVMFGIYRISDDNFNKMSQKLYEEQLTGIQRINKTYLNLYDRLYVTQGMINDTVTHNTAGIIKSISKGDSLYIVYVDEIYSHAAVLPDTVIYTMQEAFEQISKWYISTRAQDVLSKELATAVNTSYEHYRREIRKQLGINEVEKNKFKWLDKFKNAAPPAKRK